MQSEVIVSAPKLFISYSWSTPDHEAWVLNLATELRESNVDAILDKWDLREGHDANVFMEKMVTDPHIKKVLLICDKVYARKTDGRSGGVGTEAQIISGEIYKQQEQDKFVAVVAERDEHGAAYLPAYYKSRIYIDLSDPNTYSENFEKLLRWVFDKPLYQKPELGKAPGFLNTSNNTLALETSSRFRRALEAIRNNRDYAIPSVVEYFTILVAELEKIRIVEGGDPFDEAVLKSIEQFVPYRNEAIEIFWNLALYRDDAEARVALHNFFERLIPYLDKPPHLMQWSERSADNYQFIVQELFVYAVACLLKQGRFDTVRYLLAMEYYIEGQSEYGRDSMVPYVVMKQHIRSLEFRNRRLELRMLSLHAAILKERCVGLAISFRDFMQADFVLFLYSELHLREGYRSWWPDTLLYVGRYSGPFEIFARSSSLAYFEKTKALLGLASIKPLQELIASYAENRRRLPRWEFETVNVSALLGVEKIGTKP
ncbi:SEFIR domain-containing protein [Reyranella sp.]|uniref:SEFIR domain-containing protein n=1 Tax=Reyranella sp. TaxID=1929291 RepID=UPI004036BC56